MIRCWHNVFLALLSKEGEVVWNWSNHHIKEGEIVFEISTKDIMKEGEKLKTNQVDKILEGVAQRNATQMLIFFLAFDLLFSLVSILLTWLVS